MRRTTITINAITTKTRIIITTTTRIIKTTMLKQPVRDVSGF
jgi:hypothetical protein